MPETRRGSKEDTRVDPALTLSMFREEMLRFRKQLEDELRAALKKDLVEELTASISAIFRAEIQDLKVKVKELSHENEVLKEACADQLEEMVEEANRRHQKRKKVMITNLPEPSSGTHVQRKDEDNNTVRDIISDLGLNEIVIEDTQRIGKIDLKRPRLLCVTCSDKASKFDLLRSAKELRKFDKYRNIFINPDLTFIQREKNRKLRKELEDKREQGLDVIIRAGQVILRQDAVSGQSVRNFHNGF